MDALPLQAIHNSVEIRVAVSSEKDGYWTAICLLVWPDYSTETLVPTPDGRVFISRELALESAVEDARRYIDHHPQRKKP